MTPLSDSSYDGNWNYYLVACEDDDLRRLITVSGIMCDPILGTRIHAHVCMFVCWNCHNFSNISVGFII